MTRIHLDGRLVPAAEAVISVTDRGFTLGDGLFETMRVANGAVFRLDAHLARLRRSAQRVGLPVPGAVREAVTATVAANAVHEGAVRLTVSRGSTPPGLRVRAESRPTLVVTAYGYRPPGQERERGVRAMTATGRVNEQGAAAGLKHTGYMEAILAQREADDAGLDEAILLCGAGHLAEAAAANLFLVSDGRLLTPPLSCGVLPGITRGAVLELAGALGLPTAEEPLHPSALRSCAEAFLTSSLRGVVPLVEVDGLGIGSGAPGPVTRRLQERYAALVARETSGAAEP